MTRGTILQVQHGYNAPFGALGGLYARSLRQAGFRVVTLYLTGDPNPDARVEAEADDVIFLALDSRDLRGLKLQHALTLRRQLQQLAPVLVIAHRYKSLYLVLLASLGLAIPVLGVAHAFGVLQSRLRRVFLQRFRHRLTLLGVSEAVTDDLRSMLTAVPCTALPNGIDTPALEAQLLSRSAARARLGIPPAAFVFGNVGRLHADKDQATLIRAFAQLAPQHPEAQLWLLGSGKREADYRTLVSHFGLADRVILPGNVPAAATCFPAFDVYVSASDREPFGIVLTEAMLARLPVVSTDCGGAPAVLGEYALYFPRGDASALAEQLAAMMALAPAARQALGDALYARVQTHFSPPAFARRLLACVERRLAGEPPHG